jgi:sulfide:quinone oxidoreductase
MAVMHGSIQQGSDGAVQPRIVIAGGGVAALEAVLALRALAGPGVVIDLICPDRAFTHRPLTVLEPFDLPSMATVDLEAFCAEQDVTFHRARLAELETGERTVRTDEGEVIGYDRLLLATGARACDALPGAMTFRPTDDAMSLRGALDHVDYGLARSIAFVAPDPDAWLVPLYELAFMTRAQLDAHGCRDAQVTIITAESAPLAALGPATADTVGLALARTHIALRTRERAVAVEDRAVVLDDGQRIPADHVMTLPRMQGVPIPGLPHDADGFVQIDAQARVVGSNDVYAAGDMTAGFPKQGGIASRQADAAVEQMLASLGFDVQPHPFSAVLEGLLLTDASFDALDPADAEGLAVPTKILARYLAPYLAGRAGDDARDGLSGISVGGPLLHGEGHDPRATNPALSLSLPRGADPALLRAFVDGELGALASDDEGLELLRDSTLRYLTAGGNVEAVAAATGRVPATVRADLRHAEELLGHPLAERQFHVRLALELAARESAGVAA